VFQRVYKGKSIGIGNVGVLCAGEVLGVSVFEEGTNLNESNVCQSRGGFMCKYGVAMGREEARVTYYCGGVGTFPS